MISLCLITGNAEEYIERCLSSFASIADEICIVRAIGNLKPDRTLDIARDKFGARIAEYKNKAGHEDWPHVDDFAAARQMSFEMASGKYLFWCDTDDVLETGADRIRQHAERNGHPAFIFPYHIFGRGMMVPRERMVLRGSGKWKQAVHEHYEFFIQPVQAVQDDTVIVKHLPHETKTGSNERNLRILAAIPEEEMNTSLLYHLHVERALANDIPGSIEAARKVLGRDDLGKAERCELFINLSRSAQMERDFEAEKAFLHQAYAADPTRREALVLLCNNAMNTGQAEPALAYARQFKSTPHPKQTEWNDRAPLYGWVGEDMFSQALRMNGHFGEAETVRKAALKNAGGASIALVHATRGRPELAARCRKIWLDLAAHPDRVEHIFAITESDRESDLLRRFNHVIVPGDGGCVAAWNLGAFRTGAPILVQLSDDWTPPPMWDRLIIDRIGDSSKASVLAVSDGHRTDDLLCMAICTRAYISQDYFFFHPWFFGVYSDNWFTDQAYARNAVIDAKDLVFTHNHPAFDPGIKLDATYARQNAPERYREGQRVYEQLKARADWSSVPGFFNYWLFYQEIADALKDGDQVVEVGVFLGRSIIYLAQECKRLGKKVQFDAVDTFKGEPGQPEHEKVIAGHGGSIRDAFLENTLRCGVSDCIRIWEGESTKIAQQFKHDSLAFCFIDASHDYESVRADIKAWKPRVRQGGIIAGHDADHEPVARAVREIFPQARFATPVWIQRI